MRHQAGRSSLTLVSRLRTSSSPPGGSGAIASLMINSRPLPQSRSPPSHTASGRKFPSTFIADLRRVCSIAHTGAAVAEELHQLGAADDDGSVHQVSFVEIAALETGRAHVDLASGPGEVGHELLERGEPFLMDLIGVALLGQSHAFRAQKHQ